MATRVEQDGSWVRLGSLEGKGEIWYDLSGDLLIIQADDGSNVLQDVLTLDGTTGVVVKVGGLVIDTGGLTITAGGLTLNGGNITVADDLLLGIGTGNTARFSWDTTDANANELLLQMPAGGAVDVPVLVIGQAIESVDFGLYNGVVDPRIAIFGVGAVTTAPIIEFRKARGTVASPTVVTTGDDLGTLDFYGAVAAGEYVRAASIRVDMIGTIATTRGPGTITLLTATDAAPSVLTEAMRITAAQVLVLGTGEGGTTAATGNTLRGPDIITGGAGNVEGADLTFAAPLGTGTGDVGTVIFQLPIVAAAGDNIQTRAARLTLDMEGTTDTLTLLAAQALKLSLVSATDSAFYIRVGSGASYLDIDTRTTTVGVSTIELGAPAYTLASAAGAVATLLQINAHTLNLTGTTQVTSGMNTVSFVARTIAGDTPTITVDKGNTLIVLAPTEGTNVTLTAASAIRIIDAAGTPTNQYGIFIETLTAGATADYAIWIAGANAVHMGTAGTATGLFEISGATSGTVTVTVAATAGTWTFTFPATAGEAGDVLVTNGAGVSSWVSGMRSVDVQVTNAQMLALLGTDITLVAAPGANRAIVVHAVYMYFDVTTTGYTLGTAALAIGYGGDGADIAAITEAGWLDQTADAGRWYQIGAAAATPEIITPVANTAVVLRATTADMTGGNAANTLSVRVYYSVVDTAAFT